MAKNLVLVSAHFGGRRTLWYLYTSERLSSDMRLKCAKLGLELASRSDVGTSNRVLKAPTTKDKCRRRASELGFELMTYQKINWMYKRLQNG